MKTIQAILNHAAVESVSDERSSDDGYWVYLKLGFCNYGDDPVAADCGDPIHSIHADNPTEALRMLRHDVRPCSCKSCAENKLVLNNLAHWFKATKR